jgi:hypothetical protein
MRFAKYKGPEISRIEAHNERTKEKYASNPDVDISRSHLNYHLIQARNHYRAEAERQISEAGCRTRSDSVRLVETLITGSPAFFKKKSGKQIREFFEHALDFLKQHQDPETFVSAVVHMDEKTPHMHITFVPLTQDHRLSAKEIIGNRKRLTQWQDDFWKHMVSKYPELERGESASETGRDHIPPRLFKAMTRLTKQRHAIEATLESINILNAKSKAQENSRMLDVYIPGVEKMQSALKKYDTAFSQTEALRQENAVLKQQIEVKENRSIDARLKEAQLLQDYHEAQALLQRIPQDILEEYAPSNQKSQQKRISRAEPL